MGVPIGDLKALMGRHSIPQKDLATELGLDPAQVCSVLKHAPMCDESWFAAVERIVERRLEALAATDAAAPKEAA